MTIAGKTIAVLKGGPGSEREVSLESAKSVCVALRERGAEVIEVDVTGAGFEIPPGVDLAFNVIHGTFGEDGQVQKLLEARRLPYTGAGAATSEVAFDKILSKKRFIENGVPTPAFEILLAGAGQLPAMAPPFVLKPPREGSSVGVHILREGGAAAVAAALEDIARYDQVALVEPFVDGKELTVGILGNEALPVIHIQPKSGFYDIRNKYPWMAEKEGGSPGAAGSVYTVPADLGEETTLRVQRAARKAHIALGIEVYSRVDILLDSDERPWVLEVNTIPGMTSTSLLPKAAAAAGISFPELCERIALMSLQVRRP